MAAKKKAVKKSNGAANGEARGRKSAFAPEAKIKVLVGENPKREGSAAFQRFALYKSGMTVEQYTAKGGTTGDLHYDTTHKFVSID